MKKINMPVEIRNLKKRRYNALKSPAHLALMKIGTGQKEIAAATGYSQSFIHCVIYGKRRDKIIEEAVAHLVLGVKASCARIEKKREELFGR